MNILFLFYAPIVPNIGGIQRVTENLAVELKRRGHNVYYLNTNINEPDYEYKFPVQQFNINYPKDSHFAINEYINILKECHIQVIINQEIREDLLNILSNTPEGIKKITCIHLQPFCEQTFYKNIIHNITPSDLKSKLYKLICTLYPTFFLNKMLDIQRKSIIKTLDVSDFICLLSKHFIQRIKKYMPDVDETKLISVNNPNTFNTKDFIPLNKKRQILWVGRHKNTPKNFPLFIDFWIKFSKEHNDWEAIVLGDGPDLLFNQNLVKKKCIKNIQFLGNQKKVEKFYVDAAFIIQTSLYEGWGMILTESMNYGCIPCAFNTYESLQDIIENGKDGLVIPPFDIDSLICELDKIIDNKNIMTTMQYASIAKSKQFSAEKIVDDWESVLKYIFNE